MRAAFFFGSSLLLAAALQGQGPVPGCASSWDVQDPETNTWVEAMVRARMPQVQTIRGGGCTDPLRISIVFHVVDHSGDLFGGTVENDDLVAQVELLNDEYRDNTDMFGAQPCIEFCLAQNTPAEAPWNSQPWEAFDSDHYGITRWTNDAASLGFDGSSAGAEVLATLIHFPPTRYLNVWIVGGVSDGPGGTAGFATFPTTTGPLDGVVIEYPVITGVGSFDGKLLIHEIGHFLGLLHPWGLEQGNCTNGNPETDGDRVADTPPQQHPNYNATPGDPDAFPCDDNDTPNCPDVDNDAGLGNYMDYMLEDCQWVFTTGQVERMYAMMLELRPTLFTPATHSLTGIAGVCGPVELSAEIFFNSTQFCLPNSNTGHFYGAQSVEAWNFDLTDPNQATFSGPSGTNSTPDATIPFTATGHWLVELTATLDGNILTDEVDVWVTDCVEPLTAQANWYFGGYCALDFNTTGFNGVPVAVDNSAMYSTMASACVSDADGPEFYASNYQAFNGANTALGPTFGGTTQSVQGALIVPDPGNADRYYLLYTTDQAEGQTPTELRYSRLDRTTGGFVAPELDNVNISVGPGGLFTSNHLSAVPHCNGTDYWIVTHQLVDPGFSFNLISYRLTPSGFDPNYEVSTGFWVGNSDTGAGGRIVFNQKGDMAAISHRGSQTCYLYSFDRESGHFQEIIALDDGLAQGYAVAFSPSGDFLYTIDIGFFNPDGSIGDPGSLVQHDLRELDPCDPQTPPVSQTPFPEVVLFSTLQLGPDGKLYMSNYLRDEITVINYPDVLNAGQNEIGFNWRGVSVVVPGGTNETCLSGLPNLIDAAPVATPNDFYACVTCQTVDFYLLGCGPDVYWDIDCDGVSDGTGSSFSWTYPPGTTTYCARMQAGGSWVEHSGTLVNITLTATSTAACDGGSNGAIALTIEGGEGALIIAWTGPNGYTSGSEDPTGLEAGDYTVTVTDANGCTATAEFTVPGSSMTLDFAPTGTCQGETEGAVDLSITGGTGTLSYLWSNGATTQDLSGLAAGNYSVTVTDGEGCTATGSATVELYLLPNYQVVITNVCDGFSNGAIGLTLFQGEFPFTFLWSTGATTEDVSGLAPGPYNVTITDAHACGASGSFTIETHPVMVLTADITGSCAGPAEGAIDLTVDGGTPIGYTWSNGATTQDISGLAPGTYTVEVDDENGCEAFATYEVGDDAGIALIPNIQYTCAGMPNGSITLVVQGGAEPFEFAWTGPGFTANTQDIFGLLPGNYTVTVTDDDLCSYTESFTLPGIVVTADAVIAPAACADGIGGYINLSVLSGLPGFSFIWSNGATTEDLLDVPAGTYGVTITDQIGCVFTGDLIVGETAPCCGQADLVIPDGTLSSTLAPMITGTVAIMGQFIVDNNLYFYNAQIAMESGAEIVVLDGVTMDMVGTTVESCGEEMWRSITVESGANAFVFDSSIEDGEFGLLVKYGSSVVAQGCVFRNDLIGISVGGDNPAEPTVLAVRTCEFYGTGSLKLPYPGQTTAVGAVGTAGIEVNGFYLDLIDSDNFFHHLSNGVVGWSSDISISACTFQDIEPDPAYDLPYNGAAIYGRGSHGLHSIRQFGFGVEPATASFTDCRWGIYSEAMNVYSTENNMMNVGTAYRVAYAGYGNVDLLNNSLDTRFDGIQLYHNGGANHLLVQNNSITFATEPPPGTFVKGYAAIRVNEANNGNHDSHILDNDIHFRPFTSTARLGVEMVAANNYQVSDNELFMDDNAVNIAGIRTSGCEHLLVSCNNVHGSYDAYGVVLSQSAIRMNMSAECTISCNTVDGTTNGIYFTGGCYNTDLRGNNFYEHLTSLHLEFNAVINAQVLKGNLWHPNILAGHVDASYEGNTLSGDNYPITVNPATIGTGVTLPSALDPPSGWFLQDLSNPNFHCEDGETNYCDLQIRMECLDCKTRLDESIAEDELENDPYTEETKWMMRGELLEKLDQSPALMNEEQDLADFYVEMANTTVSQFKAISDENLALFDLDASITGYLAQNRAQISALLPQLRAALDALAESGLTPAQRQAYLTTATGLQSSIGSLVALNEQTLDLAANSRVLTAEAVQNANAAIGTSEQIEINEKVVNGIYLNTFAQVVDDFTASEVMDLFDVANQCPLMGGTAVYRARSLYELVDAEQDYDDPALCLAHGIITRGMEQAPEGTVQLMPNPARDMANLVYQLKEGAHGELLIHDALGRIVLRENLSYEQQRHTISIAQLAPGAFHYVVLENGGLLGEGKFAVVR